MEQAVAQLEQQNQQLTQHREMLQQSVDSSNQLVATATEQQHGTESEVSRLKSALDASSTRVEQLEADRSYYINQASQLSQKAQQLESDIAELQRAATHREELVARLQGEKQQQRSDREAAAEANSKLMIHALEQERDGLRQELERVQSRAAWAQQQLRKVQVERGTLEGSLASRELHESEMGRLQQAQQLELERVEAALAKARGSCWPHCNLGACRSLMRRYCSPVQSRSLSLSCLRFRYIADSATTCCVRRH